MKHIVIDARIIESSTGRYVQRLLENINDSHTKEADCRYTALVPSQYTSKWQTRLPNIAIQGADQPAYSLGEQWSLYWQLRGLRPDLVHFTMPQQPFLWRAPAVTTIHDMTLVRFDNIAPGENTAIYRVKQQVFHALLRVVLRRGRATITPTEFVRQDLGSFFGKTYLSKIHVTPLAGEIPDETPEPITEYENKDFLVVVGNGFPYKNVWRVIDAFSTLKEQRPDLHLLIAGKIDEFYQELEQKVSDKNIANVHFLGFITDGEKRWMLQNARAYVTASYSEGFCMPVMEAMIEGCPVIASNVSCLPETVGDAGILFNPDSSPELAKAISKLLKSEQYRHELIEKGRQHAASYSWPRMARQTVAVYRQALED